MTDRQQQQQFDDALHRLVHSTGRPKEDEQKEALKKLLDDLIELCGDDVHRWKLLVLALTQKRYHSLSPTAQEELEAAKSNKEQGGQELVYGDGERLLFYTAMEHFIQRSVESAGTVATTNTACLDSAILAMKELAPVAGGSRDLCHLLVSLVGARLNRDGKLALWKTIHVSMSGLAALGVAEWFSNNKEGNEDRDKLVLNGVLQSVATILDQDLDIVRNTKSRESHDDDALPSTMHVYIPHHERGRKRKSKKPESSSAAGQNQTPTAKTNHPDRQVVNSIVEILLWANTRHAQSNPAFLGAFQRLQNAGASMDSEDAKKQVFTLQTIIRKLRQELNTFARNKGHLLSDQFVLDAGKLSSRQVNAGKAGDLSNLTRLASKKHDSRVLRLIALRNESNPSKITKFESVSDILSNFSHLKETSSGTSDDVGADNEIAEIERNICLARLQATIRHLRDVADKQKKRLAAGGNGQEGGDQDHRPVVAVSMENSKSDHVAAVLMASAFSSWSIPTPGDRGGTAEKQGDASLEMEAEAPVKLFLSGKEYTVDDFNGLVSLLVEIGDGLVETEAVDTFMDTSSGTATTKALLNFMDRNLPDSALMFLLSKGDVRIPKDYMSSSLIARGCGLHVHNVDDLGARLKREGAKKGDITISLAWDTVDDLDLHVFLPSNEEILYSHKRSRDGLCLLDVDMNAGSPYSKEPVENVFAGDEDKKIEAPHGHYKVVVQNFAYHGPGSSDRPVPFRVVLDKNGTKENFQGVCTKTGKASDVTVCEFEYNGRTTPFPTSDEGNNATEEEKSAFNTSNMVNLTASIGQTLESLGQLVHVAYQQARLDAVRTLVNDDGAEEEADAGNEVMEAGEDVNNDNTNDVRITEADSKTLEVTSRDRLYMTLARLPAKFHNIVSQAFDGEKDPGPSLVELCAADLARRMVADRIPIRQLKSNGYPDDIIESVKAQMRVVGA